ncbi:BnaC07g47950D [Brassica napus]|uniref:ATP-dependent DNA helicase n=2 Tax=Brassica TaxID=3705 RepID=A0A078J7U3_BRANA|nr:unnamed protein product [Brassica napus]CDY61232.1 BnaC07g47950D [Brassica napus]
MTDEQRNICEEIMDAVIEKKGGLFFVYGFGGTGKTFLWRLLSAPIRSRGKIVLNVASSGEERIYLSSDSIDPSDTRSVNDQALTPDFLNSIKASGLPNHKLRLKIGCPVMLMRNIDHVGGLMNGTRLQIIDMSDLCVKARIITGKWPRGYNSRRSWSFSWNAFSNESYAYFDHIINYSGIYTCVRACSVQYEWEA